MNGRYLLEAFDQRVCDITSIYKPFGGEIILLAGYFRQILPVVKHGSRSQVIDSVMNKSPLWNHFERFRLSNNMRVLQIGNDHRLANFVKWLLDVDEGKLLSIEKDIDYILIPLESCPPINDLN